MELNDDYDYRQQTIEILDGVKYSLRLVRLDESEDNKLADYDRMSC